MTDSQSVIAEGAEGAVAAAVSTQAMVVAGPATALPAPPPAPPLLRELRGPFLAGMLIVFAFFVIGGVWAGTAPVGWAVIAPRVTSPEGSRRTVQHLEGGIIRDIRVHDGDVVTAGQTLLVLENVSPMAEVGSMTTRLRTLAATEARLTAERFGRQQIDFGHPSLANRTDPEVAAAIAQQVNQFATRRKNDAGQEGMLTQRIAQLDQQIKGAQRQLEGVRRQMELVREEIGDKQKLLEKGFARKPELLELQRAEANLLGDEGELISRIARSKEQIGETQIQILNIRQQRLEAIDEELSETLSKRRELEDQITDSLDKLSRTTIVAPVDGIVLNIRFKTVGGVIRPGEPILDIVPEHEDLVIDARIAPNDIDDARNTTGAYVIFPAYAQRNLHRVEGEVKVISADAFHDERSGQSYFTAKVHVDRERLKQLDPGIELQPGMPAEVFLSTKPRTVLEYVLQPALLVLERTFREQ
jgi:HlyD family type I secretion membrane fusion protein